MFSTPQSLLAIMYKFYFVIAAFLAGVNSRVYNNDIYNDFGPRDFDMENLENEIDPELLAQERFNIIFPGTKWCGTGDIADSYDDLGKFNDTDACCRTHDHCPDTIASGDTKYNLTNDAFYTRLSCKCDEEFRSCLRKVNSKPSNLVGRTYFNALDTQCYREDFPVTGCNRTGGFLNRKCLKYNYDLDGVPLYQWFDLPNY